METVKKEWKKIAASIVAVVILIASLFVAVPIIFPPATRTAGGYTVGTTTLAYALQLNNHILNFYAATRHWVAYSNESGFMRLMSSTTGSSWSLAADWIIFTTGGASEGFSLYYDGTYVHFAWVYNYDILYRRGTPQSGGTISWSAIAQTAFNGDATDYPTSAAVCVSSTGYPFIGYEANGDLYSSWPNVTKSSANDGTWTTDTGFPYCPLEVEDLWSVYLIALTGGKMYMVYHSDNVFAKGRLYNSGWGSEETITQYQISGGIAEGISSMTAIGDNICFVYNRYSTYQIRSNFRTYGATPAWPTTDTLVQDSVTSTSYPSVSFDSTTGFCYSLWSESPTADHIYYKIRYPGGFWSVDPVDWVNEATDTISASTTVFCSSSSQEGYIGVIWMAKSSTPWDIRYSFLQPTATGIVDAIYAVSTSTDDAVVDEAGTTHPPWDEFSSTGAVCYLGWLLTDSHYYGCGIRFTNIWILNSLTITSAYLEIRTGDTTEITACNTKLSFQDADTTLTFSTLNDYNERSRTSYIDWDNIGSWEAGSRYNTSDLSSIAQTVVNRAGWSSGNSMVVFFEDDGTSTYDREVGQYDLAGYGARLYISYQINVPEYDYVDLQSNIDAVADKGTHSGFTNQKTTDLINDTMIEADYGDVVEDNAENFVDSNTSDIDSHAGHGTSSNFTAQQDANVLYNDTLTEENTGGTPAIFGNTTEMSGSYVSIENQIAGSWFTTGGTGGYANSIVAYISCTTTAKNMKFAIYNWTANNDVGALVGNTSQWSIPASAGYFWRTFTFEVQPFLGANTKYFLLGWSYSTTGTAVLGRASATAKGIYKGSSTYGTWPNPITGESGMNYECSIYCNMGEPANYELDYEFSWTTADYDEANEYLCIRTSIFSGTAENLGVDVWDGSWKSISSALTASAWNNISISGNLSSGTIYFRFIGKTESSDIAQNTWIIECSLIHTWSTAINYRLELEEQFTAANFSRANVELCIRTGPYNTSETIKCQYWDGDSWETAISSLTTNTWNNVSVKSYSSGSSVTYTIRFIDGTLSSDTERSAWEKDATLIHTWDAAAATALGIGWTNFTILSVDIGKTLGEVNESLEYDAISWTSFSLEMVNGSRYPFVRLWSFNALIVVSTNDKLYIYCTVADEWSHTYP